MARPSGRIIRGLFRLHFNQIPSNPTPQNGVFSSANSSSGLSSLRNVILEPHSNLCIHQPTFVNRGFSQISSKHNCPTPSVEYVIRNYSSGVLSSGLSKSSCLNPEINLKLQTFSNFSSRSLGLHKHPGNLSGCRYFSFRSSDFGKLNGIFTKTVVDKPLSVVRSAFTRYREAVGLQVEAFFKRNYLVLVGATGVALCILLWRVMFGIANTFVGLSEGMAKYGFLALSTAIVAFTVSFFQMLITR
uniref:Uncharacterized protein n=1 Tax=Nelumbo nucifera TaxID=4432 RepID=A0A822ZAN0_NELNU|nr:TPA_asm: hypothetical protein HUJ06_012900 [Nelumbo nucifera]